jgi:hypothetical protein
MSDLAKAIEQFDGVALEITERLSLTRSSTSVLIRFTYQGRGGKHDPIVGFTGHGSGKRSAHRKQG